MASSLPQNYTQTEIVFDGSPCSPNYHRLTFNMDTSSASTSAAANPNINHPYHVFINHRGPDAKKNFANHLYRRLFLHGFQVFLDQKELQQCDNFDSLIKDAIESASVHVVIFSPEYAESHWCLKELLLILETGSTIILVFYNVKPSELTWTEGSYAQALQKHELRYDSATVEKWRNALYLAADKSGFELEACNSDEGELLEKVVECVLKNVKRLGFNVAKHPTGLDERIKDFENTVLFQQQNHSRKPQIVGIVGLGGVGKTALAKELFNRKSSYYRSSCFLFDVRDNATKGLLTSLQSKLLKSLTGLEMTIDSIDEGIEMLKKHLSSSQALVILDDVDDVDQVDALLPGVHTVARSDSLVLITSRDRAVLRRAGVEETSIYKLNGLRTQHSRELFCSYAFSQPHPLPGFESLVDNFIESCGGLPLSLQVFGALLYGKDDQSYWQNQLDSLQQILPTEIQRRLKISYDTLNEEEQQIFLDIACFFIGENRDKALRIWNGSGCKGLVWFQNLHNKCLVELDDENNIHMHDHLRDMGRDIANDSNLQLPRRICCSAENIDDLLQQSYNEQEPTAVRGIMVARARQRPDHNNYVVRPFSLQEKRRFVSKMSWFKRSSHELLGNHAMKCVHRLLNRRDGFLGVSLLDVEDGDMERILRRVQSPNVIWIRWYRCPYSFLPYWVPMKNLTYLEVGGSVLKTLWQDQSQAPLQLRELLIYAPLSNIPKSIGQLKHLERIIILSRQVNLTELPEEFCLLSSLKTLVLGLCSKLNTLPDSFGNLINLKHLDLSYSSNLEILPNSFGNLFNLEHLNLSNSGDLKSLPNSFGNLINLEHLDLSYCGNLKSLPNSFGNLIRLKYLNVCKCRNLSILTLGNISTLEHLNFSYFSKTEVLPPQLAHQRSLAELYLMFTKLRELPSEVGDLINLEVLSLGSSELHSLPPSLGDLKKLKKLQLSGCPELKHLPESIGLLTQLMELTIHMCPLRELPFKKVKGQRETSADSSLDEFMPRLQYFEMWGAKISEISFGERVFPNLHFLHIQFCYKLKKIEGLCSLAKLQKLWIEGCSELEEVPSVEHCRSLKTLGISQCPKLQLEEEVARQLSQQGCSIWLDGLDY